MAQAEGEYPGWLSQLFKDRVQGLENLAVLFSKLTTSTGAIKAFCEVTDL